MSTVTSLVKSGKRKIIKKKPVEPAEGERKESKAQQKPLESTGPSASTRNFLGQPDAGESRSFLGRPDPGESRSFLGRPDAGVSQDATNPQHAAETKANSAE